MGDNALAAEIRTTSGKGVARRLRVAGRIPGIVYGKGVSSRPISLDARELERLLHASSAGMNTLIDLQLDSGEEVVIVKELQREPVYGSYLHADFYKVDLTEKISVSVPLHFVGKAAGVELGGILDHPLREIELRCLPGSIPESIDVDVSALEVGMSIHVRDVAVPEGVEIETDGEQTVALCAAPRAEEEEAAVEGAEEEADLEGEGAGEGEQAPAEDAPSDGETKERE